MKNINMSVNMLWYNADCLPNRHMEDMSTSGCDIYPKDKEKRIRVFSGWLLDAVMQDINVFNHVNRMRAYMRQGSKLKKSYPNDNTIDEINIEVWAQYQKRYKEEIKPKIKRLKKKDIVRSLKRMGFL